MDLVSPRTPLACWWEQSAIGQVLYTIFTLNQSIRRFKPTMKLIDMIINYGWLPILVLGFVAYKYWQPSDYIGDNYILITFISLFITMIIHELGHAFSGIANNGKVFEFGIGIMYLILPVAYTMIDRSRCNVKQNIRILFAGIKCNLIMSGIFYFLSVWIDNYSGFFICIAEMNLSIGVFNLLPFLGLDGYRILLLGLGFDDTSIELWDLIKLIVFKRNKIIVSSNKLVNNLVYFFLCVFMIILAGLLVVILFSLVTTIIMIIEMVI